MLGVELEISNWRDCLKLPIPHFTYIANIFSLFLYILILTYKYLPVSIFEQDSISKFSSKNLNFFERFQKFFLINFIYCYFCKGYCIIYVISVLEGINIPKEFRLRDLCYSYRLSYIRFPLNFFFSYKLHHSLLYQVYMSARCILIKNILSSYIVRFIEIVY